MNALRKTCRIESYSLVQNTLFKQIFRNFNFNYSTSAELNHEGKEELFFDDCVQDLLKKLTGRDMEKVFRKRLDGRKLSSPEYKFMTTMQLEEAMKEVEERCDKKLQMPPVLPKRKEIDHVFNQNDLLKGYSDSKFIFTDITFGKTDKNRCIVVRDIDGTLRKANWEERARMNEIYFPREGRKLKIPEMFEPNSLKSLLDKGEYEFVLDRSCIQFEPDDSDYIRVVTATYEAVNESLAFNKLRSTRHYGPMVFHLSLKGDLEKLMIENLETDRLEDGVRVILLYNILHPNNKFDCKYIQGEEFSFVSEFINKYYSDSPELQLMLKKYKVSVSGDQSHSVN